MPIIPFVLSFPFKNVLNRKFYCQRSIPLLLFLIYYSRGYLQPPLNDLPPKSMLLVYLPLIYPTQTCKQHRGFGSEMRGRGRRVVGALLGYTKLYCPRWWNHQRPHLFSILKKSILFVVLVLLKSNLRTQRLVGKKKRISCDSRILLAFT